jgi:hypothetical protein
MITCQLLKMSMHQRPAPIMTNNNLPFIKLPLSKDDTRTFIRAHVDTCAALSVGNLLVHQYLIHHSPEMVQEYIQFDDPSSFEPIRLSVATKSENAVDLHAHGALTAIVRYYTGITVDDKPFILSVALGTSVAVNTIIGIPDIIALGGILDFVNNVLTLQSGKIKFRLHGGRADTGLPENTSFDSSDFVRPSPSATTLVTLDLQEGYRQLPIAASPPVIADTLSRVPHSQPSL